MSENPPQQQLSLQSITAFTANITPRISAWVDAVMDAGATILVHGKSEQVVSDTVQKIAIIIWESTDEEVVSLIEHYEAIFSNPVLSVRYFHLVDNTNISTFKHDKLRVIRFKSVAPDSFVQGMGRTLHKGRLPEFLRVWFEVEICEEVIEKGGIKYRKIIVRSYKMHEWVKELEYTTQNLYIDSKALFERTHKWMRKIEKLHEEELPKAGKEKNIVCDEVLIHRKKHASDFIYEGSVSLSKLRDKKQSEE